jgi:hypothetical protein
MSICRLADHQRTDGRIHLNLEMCERCFAHSQEPPPLFEPDLMDERQRKVEIWGHSLL